VLFGPQEAKANNIVAANKMGRNRLFIFFPFFGVMVLDARLLMIAIREVLRSRLVLRIITHTSDVLLVHIQIESVPLRYGASVFDSDELWSQGKRLIDRLEVIRA
jgi:hypothetical protein